MFFRSKIEKIKILIDELSKDELHSVHDKIAQRMLLFLLRHEEQAQILKSWQIGDRVFFYYKNKRVF